MAEQMEQINVEEIMQDIRTQIAERGYTKNELKFADVAAKTTRCSATQMGPTPGPPPP